MALCMQGVDIWDAGVVEAVVRRKDPRGTKSVVCSCYIRALGLEERCTHDSQPALDESEGDLVGVDFLDLVRKGKDNGLLIILCALESVYRLWP